MVIVIMGASGAGKSTVGRALAASLGWRFLDADDLHSPEHVEQMRRGVPLDDEDRQPWLERIHESIASAAAGGESLVVACSALKESYRAVLSRGVEEVAFVFLEATAELLHDRVAGRSGHFMPETLVDNQLAVLEPPSGAVRVDAAQSTLAQIATIRHQLRL